MIALESELRVFEARLPDLLPRHRGEFVLIHGDEFIGLYPTSHAALAEGYRRFGVAEPFLVGEVAEQRPVYSSALRRGRPA